jgi:hypothetical protein
MGSRSDTVMCIGQTRSSTTQVNQTNVMR